MWSEAVSLGYCFTTFFWLFCRVLLFFQQAGRVGSDQKNFSSRVPNFKLDHSGWLHYPHLFTRFTQFHKITVKDLTIVTGHPVLLIMILYWFLKKWLSIQCWYLIDFNHHEKWIQAFLALFFVHNNIMNASSEIPILQFSCHLCGLFWCPRPRVPLFLSQEWIRYGRKFCNFFRLKGKENQMSQHDIFILFAKSFIN